MANNTSISNLNEVEEVNSGDFFIIDTPSGTQKIDFGNVLIPLDNATFNTTISAHADDIAQNKTELKTLKKISYQIMKDKEWVNDSHSFYEYIGVCNGLQELLRQLKTKSDD